MLSSSVIANNRPNRPIPLLADSVYYNCWASKMRAALLLSLLTIASVPFGSAQDLSPVQPSMKGIELWSWRDPSSGALQFSLLVGTNRAKKTAEIRDPSYAISSVSELKQRLAKLAEGETVYWAVSRRSKEVPPRVIEDIVKFAENRNVKVVTND